MPREYQRKKNNPYLLPDNLYDATISLIRDYDRLKQRYEEILHGSPLPPDGMPRGSGVGNPTEQKAIKMEAIFQQLQNIEQALLQVPSEYRNGVFREARFGGGYPIDAARSTYAMWKQRFVYHTAENMNLL